MAATLVNSSRLLMEKHLGPAKTEVDVVESRDHWKRLRTSERFIPHIFPPSGRIEGLEERTLYSTGSGDVLVCYSYAMPEGNKQQSTALPFAGLSAKETHERVRSVQDAEGRWVPVGEDGEPISFDFIREYAEQCPPVDEWGD